MHHEETWQRNTSALLSSQARLSMHANQVFTRAMSKLGNRKPSAVLESLLFSRYKSLCLTWVTDWKGRPGSGMRQLEVALSEKGQRCLHASQALLQLTQMHPTGHVCWALGSDCLQLWVLLEYSCFTQLITHCQSHQGLDPPKGTGA